MRSDENPSSGRAAEHRHTHLAAIVESSLDAIVGKDLDGIVTSWNRSAERIFGYSADEMIGKPVRLLIPADRQDEEDRILAKLRRGESVEQLETLRLTRDGRLIDVSVTVSPIRDQHGGVVGASKIARDMTALRQHEREIERMARLYDALSQVNQAIVWTTDRHTLFGKVCHVLVERGGLRMAWIGWRDSSGQCLLPMAQFGDEQGYLQRIGVRVDEQPEGQGPSGVSFRSGRPDVCNDMHTDPRMAPWRAAAGAAGFHAAASFPLRLGGEVCGVLSVLADRPGFFQDKEMALLVEAAADVSFALDNFAREAARGEADQALREEMLFSQTMLDSMPGVVYFYDLRGRFLRWNRNFEVVTGRSAAEIVTMHPRDFFRSADQPLLEQRIAEVFETGEATVEADFLVADGGTRPYFFTGRRVQFRNQLCLVGVGIDISERKRAEAALSESRAHLVDAQRIAGIGSWTLDLRSGALTWSDQVYEIFGVDRSNVSSSFEAFISFVHPDDRARLRAAQEAALAGEAPLDIEHRIVLADGSEKVVHELAALKYDASGHAVSLEGTVHDITVRVRLQAEREQRHRAETADRLKSAFLATMSHELRTPLNSIIGFTGILLRGLAGPLNPEQNKQLGMVQASARHLLALVNDVLDISKIEAGQLVVARAPFDPRQSLQKVAELVATQAHAKGLTLRVCVSSEIGQAIGDARRFEQVLLNLLSNAIKFTDTGEVSLTAEMKPDGTGFRVVVADTGIGIRRQDQDELFQPFRQVDSGLSRSHEGTGLGLAICRRLVELMGGDISVESEFGRGSRFTVILPLDATGGP
ncbi:MAG: PAS domain S-box protein [Burkholderiales bacterium]|nr:PAS domain S-box protein [Burkholderiales bacterium]